MSKQIENSMHKFENTQKSKWLEMVNAILTYSILALCLSYFESTLFLVACQVIINNYLVIYTAAAKVLREESATKKDKQWGFYGAIQGISNVISRTIELPLQDKIHLIVLMIFYTSNPLASECARRFSVSVKTVKMAISMLTWLSCLINTTISCIRDIKSDPHVAALNIWSMIIVTRMCTQMNWSIMNKMPSSNFIMSTKLGNLSTAAGLTTSMFHQETSNGEYYCDTNTNRPTTVYEYNQQVTDHDSQNQRVKIR